MEGHYLVEFELAAGELADILVALLNEAGYTGYEQDAQHLRAYIPAAEFQPQQPADLAARYDLTYTSRFIPDTNWNAAWEASFRPVRVGDFCMIRAEFHDPAGAVTHDIVITPKMSFGTGHHATTYLMIRQMESLNFQDKRVLDFGTGTGILAILAEKCGASGVVAIDVDPWSIENATENLARNRCSRVRLHLSDHPGGEGPFDLILANITRNVLLENLEILTQQLRPGGVLIISGLLEADESAFLTAAAEQGLRGHNLLKQNGWICLKFLREG